MFKKLTYHQAFFAGSDLWVIPFEPQSFWFKKINWYTQFLLQTIHSSIAISDPLIVSTEKFFPNKSVLCIPTQQTSWGKDIYKHWLNLQKPSLRVFLKKDELIDDIVKDWPEKDDIYNLSYLKQYS